MTGTDYISKWVKYSVLIISTDFHFKRLLKKRQEIRQSVCLVQSDTATPLWTANYTLHWLARPSTAIPSLLPQPTCIPLRIRFICFPPVSKNHPTNKSKTDKINVTSLVKEHLSFLESIHDVLKWKEEKTRPNYVHCDTTSAFEKYNYRALHWEKTLEGNTLKFDSCCLWMKGLWVI